IGLSNAVIINSGTLNVSSRASGIVATDEQDANSLAACKLVNRGTLTVAEKTGLWSTFVIGVGFENSRTFLLDSGTVYLSSVTGVQPVQVREGPQGLIGPTTSLRGGKLDVSGATAYYILNGSLIGSGTIKGNVVMDEPPRVPATIQGLRGSTNI